MIELGLSQGLIALVDDDTAPELLGMKWYAMKSGRTYYAIHTTPRPQKKLLLHRILLGAPVGVHVDHIDGDGLNNRIANLRLCTRSENGMNRRKELGCSSKFKGVYWDKSKAKWHARIVLDKKHKSLGRFASELEAALAYDFAAVELFGPFAKTNASLGFFTETK